MLINRSHASPNHDSRDGVGVSLLLLHYTGMQTGAEALARLCDPAAKVSAHYLIEQNGEVFALVPEDRRAWHAGVASWRGQTAINAASVGIELVNKGHEWGYHPFPEAQMQSLAALAQDILARHSIPPHGVLGHSDVAPARKQDPGELFDWRWLASQGVGVYPPASLYGDAAPIVVEEVTLCNRLAAYGYDAAIASLPERIVAFQRRFRPARLNGQWDTECDRILDWLLADAQTIR
jgi:N-acetylmuramoyl-L-alanine amidase